MSERFKNPYFSNNRSSDTGLRWYDSLRKDGWVYFGIAVIIIGLIVYCVRANRWFYLDTITVVGNQYITVDQITQPTNDILNSKKWYIFPRRMYFFNDPEYVTEKLQATLGQQYSIEQLSVEKIFSNEIVVTIKERIPGLVYITHDNSYFYVDLNGISTEKKTEGELDSHFPRVRDANVRSISIGEQVLNTNVIASITSLNADFTEVTGLHISEYSLDQVTCYKKEYVAEKIFADEIESSANEDTKNQKKEILKQLEDGIITVDQSLDLLEEVKRAELGDDAELDSTASGNEAFLKLEAQYTDADCNYVSAVQDINIVTQDGVKILFDSGIDISKQLENLKTVLDTKIDDVTAIDYIDMRFPDRVYYR